MLLGQSSSCRGAWHKGDLKAVDQVLVTSIPGSNSSCEICQGCLIFVIIGDAGVYSRLQLRVALEWSETLDEFEVAGGGFNLENTTKSSARSKAIASGLDADVISVESYRSQMKLLPVFTDFKYSNEIGSGVFDIHSPTVPDVASLVALCLDCLTPPTCCG